jgi:hypothetical protein
MNKISCLFLSDDIFIIHVFDKYIIDISFDKQLVDIVSLIIKFNRDLLYENITAIPNNTPIKKYKGIVIYKNIEDFTCSYIIVDVFPTKKRKNNNSLIVDKFNCININSNGNNVSNGININSNTDNLLETNFIDFLTSKLKDFVFDSKNNTLYYNVLHSCDNKYTYDQNNKAKLDFDILMHSFLEINTIDCIEHVEFNLYS